MTNTAENMKETFDFNINHNVYVKLNEIGIEELKRQHEELLASFPKLENHEFKLPVTDQEGWSKWQMHNLMSSLGHLCTIGFEPPFEPNIKIERRPKT